MKKKLIVLCLLITINLSLNSMVINRVILSSDANPIFLEFWPIIARAWTKIEIKPTLALISNENIKTDETLGDVIRFEPIDYIPTDFQAQVIRLLLPCLFENDVCLLSDINILPLNKKLFIDSVSNFSNDKFITYTNKSYTRQSCNLLSNRFIPICFNAAKGKTFKEIFGIKNIQDIKNIIMLWHDISLQLRVDDPISWKEILDYTDERMLTGYLSSWNGFKDRYIKLNIDSSTQISKESLQYNSVLLKTKYYTHVQLPKLYNSLENKLKINQLLFDANLKDLINEI